MPEKSRSNLLLGLACIVFSLVVIFIWIPLDTDSGIIEKVRRRLTIGDAMAPSIAGVFILIGGFVLITFERKTSKQTNIMASNFKFIIRTLSILFLSLLIMRYSGPLLVAAVNMTLIEPLEYRLLRDTIPWKLVGYFIGGVVLIAGLIAQVESRLSVVSVGVAILATIILIIIYDFPFDDRLLPPNGDV